MLCERKPVKKYHIPYDFIYMKCPKEANPYKQNGCLGLGGFGMKWGVAANGYGVCFQSDENVLKLTVMMVVQNGAYTKNH